MTGAALLYVLLAGSSCTNDDMKAVIKQSNYTYDVNNPNRARTHVSAAPIEVTHKYLPVWKKLFMKRNNITESYFNTHIRIIETGISTDESRELTDGQHRGREYFETLYRIEVGWIKLSETDHLVIRRSEEERYLNIEEVCLEEAQADQEFQKVRLFIPIEKPPMSFEDAVQKLKSINKSARNLKPVRLTLSYPSPSYDTEKIANGGVLLYGREVTDGASGTKIEGYLNLVTGRGATNEVRRHRH